MSWILGFLGAILGAAFAFAGQGLLGLVAGALIGALLGQASRLRGRVGQLEQKLQQLEAHMAGRVAPAAVPPVAAPAPRAPEPAVDATAFEPTHLPSPEPLAPLGAQATPVPPPLQAPVQARVAVPPLPQVAAPEPEPGPREPDVFERAVQVVKGWLFEGNVPVKLGLLVLMFGIAAALKYAADAGFLSVPIEVRLSLIAAGAIAGLVWGLRSAAARPAFGLSLQGGAIGILLLVVFATYRYYHLIAPMPAFVLVIILVAGASVLAVRQNAPALAVLGFIGGYLAPVLISTGSGNHVALFSYYAVLNAAVFAIAWKRPWRALNLVGFAFTFLIGGLWGSEYYRPELFATVEPFLVLFFLFYVAIPVLYALAGRGKNGKVDGTLLFGTPLLAFPMQVGLLADREDTLPLAVSAVVVAGIYAGLALWARRNERLRTLAQSSAAMGVVFVTLAVPLALSARWTSAAWALQGVGMVWLGLRQARRLTRWTGLLLLFLAGLAWCVSLFDANLGIADRFLLNGHAMNLLLLALATLGASWLYERAAGNRILTILLFMAGLGWWVLLGAREIEVNLEPASDPTAYALFAAITAALAAALRKPLAWPRLAWPVWLAAPFALLMVLVAMDDHSGRTWFAAPLLDWWMIVALLLLSLRALLEPRSRGLAVGHLSVFALLAMGLGISLHRVLTLQAGLGDGWVLPGSLLPTGLLFVAAWRRPAQAGWPVASAFPDWRQAWLAMAGFGLAAAWLIGQFMPGSSQPLLWIPLLNPLEQSLVGGLVVGVWVLRERVHRGGGQHPWLLWAAAALLTLTMSVLRACHHLAALPWSADLLDSRIAQTSLTVAWCLAGVVAWIVGSRRRNFSLWLFGAALLAIVLLKLAFVDRQYFGNIAGIVSCMVVGLLFVIVGRIAPTPPRSEST